LSQWPYQPPGQVPQYYAYGSDPLAAARRAAVMMFVMGGLMAVGALCFGGIGLAGPEQLLAQMVQQAGDAEVTTEIMRLGLLAVAVAATIGSVAMIVLGVFVRRGVVGATITSIVITGIFLALALLNAATTLPGVGARRGGAHLAGAICGALFVPLLLGLLLTWLAQALKGARQMAQVRQQYHAAYWQYYQQQQQAAPPPPPMGPPPPPAAGPPQ